MSEQLLELLILVSESAQTTKLTVFVIVEWSALRNSVLLFLGLLNSICIRYLFSRVLVGAILPKSACSCFHPIVAGFSLLLQVCLLIRLVFRWWRRASWRVLTAMMNGYLTSYYLIKGWLWIRNWSETLGSHLNWEEWLRLRKIRLIRSASKFGRNKAEGRRIGV